MGNLFSEDAATTRPAKSVSSVPVSTLTAKELGAVKHLFQSWQAEGNGEITLDILRQRLPAVTHFPEMLKEQGHVSSEGAFLSLAAALCKPSTPRHLMETLFHMAEQFARSAGEDLLQVLMQFVLEMVLSLSEEKGGDDAGSRGVILRMSQFALGKAQRPLKTAGGDPVRLGGGSPFDLTAFVLFANEWAPSLLKAVQTFALNLFLPFDKFSGFVPFQPPTLADGGSSIIKPRDLVSLSLYSNLLQGRLRRLYSSSHDGYSFQHILSAITGYDGPTLLLIRPRPPKTAVRPLGVESVVFGALAADRWKEERKFFGGSSTFLFTLTPELRILGPRVGGESNFQWLSTKTSNPKTHGLAMGGTADLRGKRIFLPSSLDEGWAGSSCGTFQSGTLVPSWARRNSDDDVFDIDSIEIWAVGGDHQIASALQARGKQRALNEDTMQKARSVDRAAFFNSTFDQEMFLGKTMAHKSEMQNRD